MSKTFVKPALAEDALLDKVQFPVWAQPKIDGVRAMNLNGQLTGRSLDEFKGFGVTDFFSRLSFVGFDGEMILGSTPNSTERLCALTTGAMGRFKGETEMADLHWWVFDLVRPDTVGLSYEARYYMLAQRVLELDHPRVHLVPHVVVHDLDQLKALIAQHAAEGYEGTIIRNPRAAYKAGRATLKGQELWRVKASADSEILVTGLTEGNRNANEAKTNSLGRTERSSAKDGLVPNGQIGSIQGTMLADFHEPVTGALLFPKGLPVTIAPGHLTIAEATEYFTNPEKIVGHIVKFKHMPFGVKDVPRQAVYLSHRLAEDMSA